MMAGCGEKLTDQKICEKIMRSLVLHSRFDYIVCAIEESRDIASMSLEELQGSLVARELRLNERSMEKTTDQALQATQINKK